MSFSADTLPDPGPEHSEIESLFNEVRREPKLHSARSGRCGSR